MITLRKSLKMRVNWESGKISINTTLGLNSSNVRQFRKSWLQGGEPKIVHVDEGGDRERKNKRNQNRKIKNSTEDTVVA